MKCKNVLCVFNLKGKCYCKREPSIDAMGNCENVFLVARYDRDPFFHFKENYYKIPYGADGNLFRREWRKYNQKFEEEKPDYSFKATLERIEKNFSNGERL